ncbi:MAG: helix-turn-helix domain-containing protein [Thermoplasmata archaeon]
MKPKFTQDDIGCHTVLEYLYNLPDIDKKIFTFLSKGGEYRANEVAKNVDRDQSTAYRSLERLVDCGMVYKEKHNIRNGGYYFLYSSRPMDLIKEEALECLDMWYEKMKNSIEGTDGFTD